MRVQDALPSTKFISTAGSIILAGGLIVVAGFITNRPTPPTNVEVSSATQNNDWKKSLEEIQSQSPLNRLPPAPDAGSVERLLNAATSDNVTDTVARTVFIKISNATAQGLGTDIPTQDSLIEDAMSKIALDRGAPLYTTDDLNLVDESKNAMRTYGNAVMSAILSHPNATMKQTLALIGTGTDSKDPSKLSGLMSIGAEYTALAKELTEVPTPKTLAPLHLAIVNNIARMGTTYPDMEKIVSDPLRGLAGLQLYQSLADETGRVFTSIATVLSKNGILFNKDEPGVTWNSLVP